MRSIVQQVFILISYDMRAWVDRIMTETGILILWALGENRREHWQSQAIALH